MIKHMPPHENTQTSNALPSDLRSGVPEDKGASPSAKSRLYGRTKTGPQPARAEFRATDHLIKGVIRHPSLGLHYADDGVGKTWLAMALALAVAQGSQWLHPAMRAPKFRHVLYVDGEMTEEELQECFLAAIEDDLDLARKNDWQELLDLISDFYNQQGINIESMVLDNWSTLINEKD
jgi:hypothetical protein